MKNINIENPEAAIDVAYVLSKPFGMVIKRAVDIVGSIALLIMLAPVFIIISIIVKKEGGSIFFLSKRLGKNGKEFNCLKFRTMVPNAEQVLQDVLAQNQEMNKMWETHRKIKGDPRVTRIGNALRKSSLDELLQLINIIKGEMSLVGPRPILLDEEAVYGERELEIYYSVRPGLTGLWQVSGRNNTTFRQRVGLDMEYVKNWSILNDLVILFKTFLAIIKKEGAY